MVSIKKYITEKIKVAFLFVLSFLPKKVRIFIKFTLRHKYFPKLNSPSTYNEKINYRKLYDKNPLLVTCSDKIKVRDYLKSKGYENLLIPLLYQGDYLTASVLEKLQKPYIIKANHNSGKVIIVKEDDTPDFEKLCLQANAWLSKDYGKKTDEQWYSSIQPKILIEKLISNPDGSSLVDYKFHVFNKSDDVRVILQVDFDRFSDQNRTLYDQNGNILNYSNKQKDYRRPLPKTSNLSEMVELAKNMASDFDYVRVDLYNINGKIYFSELTFAHAGGYGNFSSKSVDEEWGSWWDLRVIHNGL